MRVSVIDKKIAELQAEIVVKQEAIAVLRSVQKAKPVKPRKVKAAPVAGTQQA